MFWQNDFIFFIRILEVGYSGCCVELQMADARGALWRKLVKKGDVRASGGKIEVNRGILCGSALELLVGARLENGDLEVERLVCDLKPGTVQIASLKILAGNESEKSRVESDALKLAKVSVGKLEIGEFVAKNVECEKGNVKIESLEDSPDSVLSNVCVVKEKMTVEKARLTNVAKVGEILARFDFGVLAIEFGSVSFGKEDVTAERVVFSRKGEMGAVGETPRSDADIDRALKRLGFGWSVEAKEMNWKLGTEFWVGHFLENSGCAMDVDKLCFVYEGLEIGFVHAKVRAFSKDKFFLLRLNASTFSVSSDRGVVLRSLTMFASTITLSLSYDGEMIPQLNVLLKGALLAADLVKLVTIPKVHFEVEVRNVFVDYYLYDAPLRIIAEVSSFKTAFENAVIMSGHYDIFVTVHCSNKREPLPIRLFEMDKFDLVRYGFAQIGQIHMTDARLNVFDELKEIEADKAYAAFSFCSDSFELMSWFLAHISKSGSEKSDPLDNMHDLFRSDRSRAEFVTTCKGESFPQLPGMRDKGLPFVSIKIRELVLSVSLFEGHDLGEVFDLRVLEKPLEFTEDDIEHIEFDVLSSRNENRGIEIYTTGQFELAFYREDSYTRWKFTSSSFQIRDHIPESKAKLMMNVEAGQIVIDADVNQASEASLTLDLPDIGMLITHPQCAFLSEFFGRSRRFTSQVSRKRLSFRVFGMKVGKLTVCASLKYFLKISLEDVELDVPQFVMRGVPDVATLIGEIVIGYIQHMHASEALNLVSGLPVLRNITRVAESIGNIFTVDVRQLGIKQGIGVACGAVCRALANETVSVASSATSLMQNLLESAVSTLSGETNNAHGFKTAIATLVITTRAGFEESGLKGATVGLVKQAPRVMLTPGIIAFKYATKMLSYLKDNNKYEKDLTP